MAQRQRWKEVKKRREKNGRFCPFGSFNSRSENRLIYLLGSAAAALAHERSGPARRKSDPLGGLRRPHPQASAVEGDWPFQSSPPAPVAAAAADVVKLVAVVVEVAEEGAAVACRVSAAAGSGNQVTWEESDAVEALSCVLARGSLFGWVGSGGRSLAGWRWRMEAG